MTILRDIIYSLSRRLNLLAHYALMLMLLLACGNIIMRFFGKPFSGTYELVGYLGAIAASFPLAYTQTEKRHISLAMVVSHLRPRTQKIVRAITVFLSIFTFALCTWQTAVFATYLWKSQVLSELLEMRYFPVVYGVAFGIFTLCLVLLTELIEVVSPRRKK